MFVYKLGSEFYAHQNNKRYYKNNYKNFERIHYNLLKLRFIINYISLYFMFLIYF